MIPLKILREYWESLPARVDGLKSVSPLTIEANMADKVGKIPADQSPALFYLPPSSEGGGSVDSYAEENMLVVFVMIKYNPLKTTSAAALEAAQPVAEAVKAAMLEDSRRPCHFMKIDNQTISTLPETEFFGNWAGWSIGFTIKS